jgi:predicted O-methyltransferase YrrM
VNTAAATEPNPAQTEFEFSNVWFEAHGKPVWDALIPQLKPRRILEIGSYEGKSACYLIDKLGSEIPIEIHCVDSWEGGSEHQKMGHNMSVVRSRFQHNIELASSRARCKPTLIIHEGYSDVKLPEILSSGKARFFDFIYIDGSHQAPDVLFDAVVGFKLLKIGGVIAFDDYTWSDPSLKEIDVLMTPKIAIDAFVNLYARKIRTLVALNYQFYVQKTSD